MTDIKQNTFTAFQKTTVGLLNLLNPLSDNQINFHPKVGWSAGQLGEHLLKSYASVNTMNGKTRRTERPFDQKLEPIKTLFSDISIKMNSPKPVLPSEKSITKKDLIIGLKDRIEQMKEVIQHKDLSVTCIDFSIPEYGEFTRFEWIWFNIYHTQRHVHQLENIIEFNYLKTSD